MEEDPGNNPRSVFTSKETAKRNQLQPKRYSIIQKSFQKPVATSLEQLRKWHEEYKAAKDQFSSQHAIVQEVQTDELDEEAIETCIAALAKEIPVTNGFCGDCQHLFHNWPDLGDPNVKDPKTKINWPGSGADWKHTVAQECHTLVLEAAARNGCKFCAFLMQMLRDAELLQTFRRLEMRLGYLEDTAMATLSLQNWGMNTSQLLWINLPGKVCNHCNSAMAQETGFESAALESSADTYDEQKDLFDIAKIWTNRCSENHENCNKNDHNVLPTRLISIASDVPRLVLTAGWETKPRYSTLSHRWGDDDFLKLTEKNHDSFLEKIPLEELPETFKDAVQISRGLGLDYLWIDSLCILQGNTDDWRREAGLMSYVYGGSFVNIAAASARSVHEGCLLKTPYMVDGLRASIKVNGGSLVREFRSRSVYDLSTTNSHLATRGWAIQERILPPRTIHFGHRGAFWECRTMTANEFLPDGFPNQLGHGLLNEKLRQSHLGSWWRDVVRLYSAANLTYSHDKLPALSGIVRRIHEERGGQYLSGMWREEDIEAQLCWRATRPQKRPPWRAPSWSWASVDGEVLYQVRQPEILETVYAHVLDAEMTLRGQNPFGEVREGCLHIACSGMLAARLNDGSTVKIQSVDNNMDVDRDYPVNLDCLDDEWRKDDGTVYLLPLLSGRTGSGMYRDDKQEELIHELKVCGILLRKRGDVAGEFCRVGMFTFYKDSTALHRREEIEYFEPFSKAFENGAKPVAESVCAKVIENVEYPEERYVISVY